MFGPSGWHFKTSSGVGLTMGEFAEVTGQYLRLYLTSPSGEIYKIVAEGRGGGVGASVGPPANVTGSTTDFFSYGTAIRSLSTHPITIEDLSDILIFYSVTLTAQSAVDANAIYEGSINYGMSVSGSHVYFMRRGPIRPFGIKIPIVGSVNIVPTLEAYCFIAGNQLSTPTLGADVTITLYTVLSHEVVTKVGKI